jgi:pyrimidine-specific ribonucleoside hydrolase
MNKRVGWPVVVVWTLLTALTLAACTPSASEAPGPTATPFTGTPRPVIIDTDMAADDWLAILYVLQRPDLSVKAITVTGAGEAHCGPGVRNALGLTSLAGQPAIPVACGREAPLRGEHTFPAAWRQGVDALLDLRLPENTQTPAAQTAPELIASLVEASPDPMTLLTLGPLTNVAEALQADPDLAGHLAMIYIMGGAVDAPGNLAGSGAGLDANTGAEWNIYVDPYAANVVLRAGAPVTFVPLDATNHAPVTHDFYNRLAGQRTTPEAQFAYDVLTQEKDFLESGGLYFWDPLAAAVLSDESLAEFESRRLAVVEAEGDDSGRLMSADSGPEVRFAASADGQRFESLFLETLNAP